jgi:SOS response regulatory protein OraA/RecX
MTEPDSDKKIMQKAGALLARRAYSRGEMRNKLDQLGEEQQIELVLDRLEQLNLLNDFDYAYNSACQWIKRDGWGPVRVYHRLLQRQVPAATAEAALQQMRQEIGDSEALEAYLAKRIKTQPMPAHRKGIQKLIASLQRRGYPHEAIWDVLRKRIPAGAWQDLDTGE